MTDSSPLHIRQSDSALNGSVYAGDGSDDGYGDRS